METIMCYIIRNCAILGNFSMSKWTIKWLTKSQQWVSARTNVWHLNSTLYPIASKYQGRMCKDSAYVSCPLASYEIRHPMNHGPCVITLVPLFRPFELGDGPPTWRRWWEREPRDIRSQDHRQPMPQCRLCSLHPKPRNNPTSNRASITSLWG